MLVPARNNVKAVVIGRSGGFDRLIKDKVLEIRNGHVTLHFEADADVPIHPLDQICWITDAGGRLPQSTEQAINRLLEACYFAADAGCNIWEFAVTIAELSRDGVSESDLRWLVCRGFFEHATEVTTTSRKREFNRDASLRFCKWTAFVITSAGVAFSREFVEGFACCDDDAEVSLKLDDATPQLARSKDVEDARSSCNGDVRPNWDRDRRELRLGRQLVKVFKLPSRMQETILMAFEEEQWPPKIDDPLPVHPDLMPKRRLHDTIKGLNRNQKSCLIRFMGDGTGEGIRWELIPAADKAEHSNLV
jgi:hypothetical protein